MSFSYYTRLASMYTALLDEVISNLVTRCFCFETRLARGYLITLIILAQGND